MSLIYQNALHSNDKDVSFVALLFCWNVLSNLLWHVIHIPFIRLHQHIVFFLMESIVHPCNYLPCCCGILWLPSCQSLCFSFWLLYFNSSCWRYFRMGKCHTLKILPNSHILIHQCIDPCTYANTYTHCTDKWSMPKSMLLFITLVYLHISSDIFEKHYK